MPKSESKFEKWLKEGYEHFLDAIKEPQKTAIDLFKFLFRPKIGFLLILFIGSGWVMFEVGGCSSKKETNHVKNDFQTASNQWIIEQNELEKQNNILTGELTNTKQERDKYQVMVAPFQAMALKLYTNAPVEERLDIFASQMFGISSNFAAAIKANIPTFDLYLNNLKLTNGLIIPLKADRTIAIKVQNTSLVSADKLTVGFLTPLGISPSNVINSAGWLLEPSTPSSITSTNIILNHWIYMADKPLASKGVYHIGTFGISTNMTWPVVTAQFEVYSSHSELISLSVTLDFAK